MDTYVSKPWHTAWSILLLFAGCIVGTVYDGWWDWFGVALFLLGISTAVYIIFVGMYVPILAKWDKINYFVDRMKDNKNPYAWEGLGFKLPDEPFRVTRVVSDDPREKVTQEFVLPGTVQQFQTLCDGVLVGRPISETEWVYNQKLYSSTTYRLLKKELETRKLIVLKNINAPKQGFTLTKAGSKFFLQYASDGIRIMLLAEGNRIAPSASPTLLEDKHTSVQG